MPATQISLTNFSKINVLEEKSFLACCLAFSETPEELEDNSLLLVFDIMELNKLLLTEIRNSSLYISEKVIDQHLIYQIGILPKYGDVKNRFLNGEYSLMNREYVRDNFSPTVATGVNNWGQITYSPSTNYQILTKDIRLKELWEKRIGQKLPHDCEVWSKPNLKEEVYENMYPMRSTKLSL